MLGSRMIFWRSSNNVDMWGGGLYTLIRLQSPRRQGDQESGVQGEERSIMADIEEYLTKEEMADIGLEPDQVKVLKGCFDGFADEDGAIPADNVGGILSMMGMKVKPTALREIIEEIDEDGEYHGA